jgi:hypothetical protein
MRQIKECGFKSQYEEDAAFALNLRLLGAIAFLPLSEVERGFEAVVSSCLIPVSCGDIMQYFEETWIGSQSRNGIRRAPRYSHKLWNCYDSVLERAPKTSNAIEAWHRGFETTLDTYHPHIYRLVEALKREQTLTEAAFEKAIAGDPAYKRRKYQDAAVRLHRAVLAFDINKLDDDDYDDYLLLYLRGIAHNLSY